LRKCNTRVQIEQSLVHAPIVRITAKLYLAIGVMGRGAASMRRKSRQEPMRVARQPIRIPDFDHLVGNAENVGEVARG